MPLVSTDIKIRLSGGAANANPNLSLGGAKSSTEITNNLDNNIFDDISSGESISGDVEFRCVYAHNAGAIAANNVRVYILVDSSSNDDTWDIAIGSSPVNGTEQTIADESTAPLDITFTHPTDYTNALIITSIPAGQHQAIWYRRTVLAGAITLNDVSAVINFEFNEQ